LIDAIITHQINQGSNENSGGSGSSANQPTRAGDRLFQVNERYFSFCILFLVLNKFLCRYSCIQKTSVVQLSCVPSV
jgi:hypothetical protein